MERPLTIYKASAGSGKTFTLATEYIKLLVENPQSYKSILAVTFTNKATEEMKLRILSQLYGIWKMLEDSSSYINKVCKELDIEPSAASHRAGIALELLLHNYSFFRVETIDTFFQSILRNLARELDLTANLHIGLGDIQVEEQAVDELIEGLDKKDEILQWILKYIKDNISDDKSWNVISSIKRFGTTIFKDIYKQNSQRLAECINRKDFFRTYTALLRKQMVNAEATIKSQAKTFFKILEENGLSYEDLASGRRGIAGFFMKLENGQFDNAAVTKTVGNCLEDATKWTTKTSKNRDTIINLATASLIPLLNHALEVRAREWKRYKSSELTLRHLDQLRLLDSIEKKVRQLNDDANRFLLSDTQFLLNSLIRSDDSPFIFEKIGTRLEHVMIDEFQDTGVTQWSNFKVLLQECMSHENSRNLIVGDVKQSIYRWRSGDWRLLNNIAGEFPYPDKSLEIKTLKTNYRSKKNIINFNNAFFKCAAEKEYQDQVLINKDSAAQLKSAYSDVVQDIPSGKKDEGYVEISLLPADNYEEETMVRMANYVELLLSEGIQTKDIAILVRANRAIPLIANYFAENVDGVSVVSDEAFRLDASPAVNIIVLAMQLIAHPDDKLTKGSLILAYQNLIKHNDGFCKEILADIDRCDCYLPEAFVNDKANISHLPLYEMAERISQSFELQNLPGQSAYICAFYDQLNKFAEDMSATVETFIKEWNSNISSTTIQGNEIDGIRIISIHKSKGLEFPNVIIPFCDWQLEKPNANIIWCQPNEEPYTRLPLVPIDYSSKLTGTVYEQHYMQEKLQNCVDNLNLLYVAFTRAGNNLFVIGKRNSKSSRSALIEQCLKPMVDQLNGSELTGIDHNDTPIIYIYGCLAKSEQKNLYKSENVFSSSPEPVIIELENLGGKVQFRQSNKSREFVGETNDEHGYIKMGCILHKLFSMINTTDDVDKALSALQADGLLPGTNITAERISSMLHKVFEDKRIAEWFSDKWTVFNECSILRVDKESGRTVERRPDRVMTDGKKMVVVDFKFGKPKPEYETQVKEYMELLRSMGYTDIKGYLWFVYTNKIVEV